MVIFPEAIRVSRSLRRKLRKRNYTVSFDRCCRTVIERCAEHRGTGTGDTWLTAPMRSAYGRLHSAGLVHSVEVWFDNQLAGGLYGVCLGRIFFGESMFSRRPDASKIALVYLAGHLRQWGFPLIDCQVASDHLRSMGATIIARSCFTRYLQQYASLRSPSGPWQPQWQYPRAA